MVFDPTSSIKVFDAMLKVFAVLEFEIPKYEGGELPVVLAEAHHVFRRHQHLLEK